MPKVVQAGPAPAPLLDLPVVVFRTLRDAFFDASSAAKPFDLRDKRNTQDDPFDEYVHQLLHAGLADATCVKASGPLITPDMVAFRQALCLKTPKQELRDHIGRIIGIEVKKIERTASGGVARASGMDYNTTPPCGVVRVYDEDPEALDIRGFYLFVCLEGADGGKNKLTALCLADGNVLNRDFDLYLQITGRREKRIGLGTYGDGADRQRPMLIFANPIGVKQFDKKPILIHSSPTLETEGAGLRKVYELTRTGGDTKYHFTCYRDPRDIAAGHVVAKLEDPFVTPERVQETQGRGKFVLPFSHDVK
jgi:hypothetical protein